MKLNPQLFESGKGIIASLLATTVTTHDLDLSPSTASKKESRFTILSHLFKGRSSGRRNVAYGSPIEELWPKEPVAGSESVRVSSHWLMVTAVICLWFEPLVLSLPSFPPAPGTAAWVDCSVERVVQELGFPFFPPPISL